MVFLLFSSCATPGYAPVESCAEIDSQLKSLLEKDYPNRDRSMDDWTLLEWRYITINDLEKQGIKAGRDCPAIDMGRYHIIREIFRQIDIQNHNKIYKKINHNVWHEGNFQFYWMATQLIVGSNLFPQEFWVAQCKRIDKNATLKGIRETVIIDGQSFPAILYICAKVDSKPILNKKKETAKDWWKRQKGKLRL